MAGRGFRVAVVGAGQFGKNHVRVLHDLGALAAVCDVSEGSARFYGEKYGVGWFTSVRGLESLGLDAAVVATPTATHFEVAVELMEMGVRLLLLEKPFTTTAEEARRLAEAARPRGVRLMPGYIERFNQAVALTREMLRRGEVGTPILFYASRVRRWPERVVDVGVVKDTAIHDIDILRFMTGERPTHVYATAGRLAHHRHEDYANIVLRYASGKAAVIEANWLTPRTTRRIRVTGSEGVIDADLVEQSLTLMRAEETRIPSLPPGSIGTPREPLRLELQHLLECLEKNLNPSPGPEDAVAALEVADAALRSSEEGKPVTLPS